MLTLVHDAGPTLFQHWLNVLFPSTVYWSMASTASMWPVRVTHVYLFSISWSIFNKSRYTYSSGRTCCTQPSQIWTLRTRDVTIRLMTYPVSDRGGGIVVSRAPGTWGEVEIAGERVLRDARWKLPPATTPTCDLADTRRAHTALL